MPSRRFLLWTKVQCLRSDRKVRSRIRLVGWLMVCATCLLAPAAGGFPSSHRVHTQAEIPQEISRAAGLQMEAGRLAADSELGVFGAEDAG